jgi:glycosyltransferase involved in cell wall biosynthesis
LDEFNGRIETFEKVTDCFFDAGEIIIGVGMWASFELSQLNPVPNPKLQYIHGSTPWEPELMKRALSLPFPKIVVASYLEPLVKSYNGGDVLEVIHNGIDQKEYFSSIDGSEKDGIGTIFSSHPAKDPQTLLAVLKELSVAKPNIPIRIFSSDKRPKQVEKDIFWRFPSIEKAREIYSKSLVWVLSSSSEGFPAPPLEAMACGCVVVATDCGGSRDMIIDGYNGFLVKVGGVKQIVDRVLLLLDDENLRNNMRLKAEESVKRFSWEDTIDKLENVLRQVS